MVNVCAYQGCDRTIGDRFEYCYAHYATIKGIPIEPKKITPHPVAAPVSPPSRASGTVYGGKAWHDDPVVDALLKINSNLGRIAKLLEEDAARGGDDGSDDEKTPEADETPVIVDTFP